MTADEALALAKMRDTERHTGLEPLMEAMELDQASALSVLSRLIGKGFAKSVIGGWVLTQEGRTAIGS